MTRAIKLASVLIWTLALSGSARAGFVHFDFDLETPGIQDLAYVFPFTAFPAVFTAEVSIEPTDLPFEAFDHARILMGSNSNLQTLDFEYNLNYDELNAIRRPVERLSIFDGDPTPWPDSLLLEVIQPDGEPIRTNILGIVTLRIPELFPVSVWSVIVDSIGDETSMISRGEMTEPLIGGGAIYFVPEPTVATCALVMIGLAALCRRR